MCSRIDDIDATDARIDALRREIATLRDQLEAHRNHMRERIHVIFETIDSQAHVQLAITDTLTDKLTGIDSRTEEEMIHVHSWHAFDARAAEWAAQGCPDDYIG